MPDFVAKQPIKLEPRGPIIVITYLGGATDEQYAQYLQSLTTMLRQLASTHSRLVQVHDASAWTKSNARQREMQADWIKEHMLFLRNHGGYSAFVFKSVLIRGGLTAVMWLVEMPGPYMICATLDEALRWAERQVASPRPLLSQRPAGR